MEKDRLYLLTLGQVLENSRNASNVSLYYNRISVVNNLRRYENNYCWVHETKSNLQTFPEDLQCACACVDASRERDLKEEPRRTTKCPQEIYVRNITTELNKRNLIVDFSSSQCISLIYKGGLYLYSNLSTCKLSNTQTNYADKESSRSIICEDCKIGDFVEFSRADIDNAIYNIIEKGEDQKYGLTLLDHASLNNIMNGLEKVQDSVKSIGILEGLILDEPRESSIDSMNVIDCDIVLEDVNAPEGNGAYTNGNHELSNMVVCEADKQANCKSCKYINDLNKYLNTPINSYGGGKECRASACEGKSVPERDQSMDSELVRSCVQHARELVEKAAGELDSICSSMINQLNGVCQPPLNISIRFLEHFMCFEYLIEYSCDVNQLDKDNLYGASSLDRQNVILHELIQANVLSKQVLEDTFKIILNRIKLYTTPKARGRDADAENRAGVNGLKREAESPKTEKEVETPSPEKSYLTNGHGLEGFDMNDTKLIDPPTLTSSNLTANTMNDSLGHSNLDSNVEDTDNPMSSDESYKNSFQDLDQMKKTESSDEEMADIGACPDIYPYWWRFYVEDNTLGEGDLNGRYEGIRRFTRSYLKEESSTPKNKKTGNGANYLLTRCVSSDFSTKSNINVSGLHSSRETLSPSEFNQSQPAVGQGEHAPCFCKSCIPFLSNITRLFPGQMEAPVNVGAASAAPSPESSGSRENLDAGSISFRDDDTEKDFNVVNGLRRSIRAALDVSSAIRKKISSEHKPLLDTLNVALLSSFRLGEFLFNNPSVYAGGAMDDGRFDLYDQLNFKDSNVESARSRDTSMRSAELVDSARSPVLEAADADGEKDVGELIYLDIGVETNRSTFENDQYLNYDIMSEDDACSFSSRSSQSPKMFKRKSPTSRSRRQYRSLSSFENLPSSRRSTRELSQTDDMYIYDMNNLSDKGEFDEWYNEDSDSSKKSVKYVQKRMPPSRPSVSNLTEIYGSQDMLIPMGPLPIGVYFDASRKLWRCQWRENGKFRTKGFSLGHYNTLADARHACILFRCQVGNMNIQPEWLTPNYIKVSDLLNRRASQPSGSTPKKSSRKKKRQEDMYEPYP